MKNDLHIAEVQDAIERGDFVTTMCGKFIQCRTIQHLSEGEWIPGSKAQSTEPRGICHRCLEVRVLRYLVSDRETVQE